MTNMGSFLKMGMLFISENKKWYAIKIHLFAWSG